MAAAVAAGTTEMPPGKVSKWRRCPASATALTSRSSRTIGSASRTRPRRRRAPRPPAPRVATAPPPRAPPFPPPPGPPPLVPAGPRGRMGDPGDPPLGEPVIPGDERGPGAQRGVAALPEDPGDVLAAAFHRGYGAARIARLACELGLRVTRRAAGLLQGAA